MTGAVAVTLSNFAERAKRLRYDIERADFVPLEQKLAFVNALGDVELGLTQSRILAEHHANQQLTLAEPIEALGHPGADLRFEEDDAFPPGGFDLPTEADDLELPVPEAAE